MADPSSNHKATIGAVVGTVGAIALAPVVVPAALGIIGFGSAGVVGGSIAAGIQAGIGNVAAGSLFAVAQSIGAGGALPTVVYAAAGAMGAAAGARSANNDADDTVENPNEFTVKRRLERCYICGSRQHDGSECPENANGFLTKGLDGKWSGPEGEEICFKHNRISRCRHTECKLIHACSRCGREGHNAQNHFLVAPDIIPPLD